MSNKIKKITITIQPVMNGLGTTATVDIETKNIDDKIRGVEAIKILNDTIGQILDEIL